jgi:hypothetical protein
MIKVYLLIVGISWITFYIWRIATERMPQEISSKMLIIAIIMIIVHSISMYIQIREYTGKKKETRIKKIIKRIIEIIYLNPIKHIWENYIIRMWRMKDIVKDIGKVSVNRLENILDIEIVIIKWIYIPRILFIIILYCEIILCKRIELTYKLFPIILIPLIVSAILSIIFNYYSHLQESLEKNHILVESLANNEKRLTLKQDINLQYFDDWILNDKIITTFSTVIKFKETYKPFKRISILITYIYILSWLGCLLFIFIPDLVSLYIILERIKFIV